MPEANAPGIVKRQNKEKCSQAPKFIYGDYLFTSPTASIADLTSFPSTMTSDTQPIFDTLADEGYAIDWNLLLTEILTAFDCSTGTIHTFDRDSELLHLKAYQGIPEFLLPKMTVIPIGKGMAGVAAERNNPYKFATCKPTNKGWSDLRQKKPR